MGFRVGRDTLEALEWPEVVARLADHCRTARARLELLDSADPGSPDASDETGSHVDTDTGAGATRAPLFEQTLAGVRARLAETDEARGLLDAEEPAPIAALPELEPVLTRAAKGAVLEAAQLLDVRAGAETLSLVARHLATRAERAPRLADVASVIDAPDALAGDIAHCIDRGGEVLDRASSALAEARRETIRLSGELQRRLERYLHNPDIADNLSDQYYTVRNDRYVLPVKADAKGRVRGIVHDASRSGTTLFIEPEGAVELNNKLKRAELDAQHETDRVLRRLSEHVAEAAPTLAAGLDALALIDRAFARARLSQDMDAHSPRVDEAGVFDLPDLRHPLIEPGECVANDVRLGEGFQVLVLSGPNAGGKTVTLKAVALAALMVRAGLHVPAGERARVDLVEDVIADIGDGQDIGESLSTFSAHMANLARIVERAGRHSLVVLDEIGVGTDPGEGAALAQAILERLADDGARVITTTHYNLLKEMADVDPRFENASVEFDPETLAPTYRLHVGVPGASSAAAVASRMGMPSEVLERANALTEREDRQLDRMLAELASSRATLESERQQVARLRAEGEAARAEYTAKLERLQERRDELYRSMRDDLDAAFRQAHGEVASVIRELQRGPTAQQAAAAREQLEGLAEQAREAEQAAGVKREAVRPADLVPVDWRRIRAGDPVRIAGGREGALVSLPDRKGRATVRVGAAKLVLPAEQIGQAARRSDDGSARKRVRVERAPDPAGGGALGGGTTECDLRGHRVDEALDRLADVIDRASADGRDRLRVIHGHGTGALRKAIREHLRTSPYVSGVRAGGDDEGGQGVTVADLA